MSDIWLTDGTPRGTRRIAGGSAALFFRGTLMSLEVDLMAVRPCALGLSACDVDDDGDGFSTEIEVATGSRWWEEDSTPLGPDGGGPAGDLEVSEASFRVTGFKLGADVLRVEGTLPVRAGFEPEGASVTIDAGGVIRTLSLDRRGRAREGDADFRLRVRRRHGAVLADPGVDLLVSGPPREPASDSLPTRGSGSPR